MSDPILVVLVVGLIGERAWSEWLAARERRYLTNAQIANTPAELKQLESKPPRREPKKVAVLDGYDGPVGI